MTAALLEWETIDSEQINDIMEGRAPRAPKPSNARPNPPPNDAPATPEATITPAQET
ncbi:MAG: hypothetical protein RL020_352, partial [Pseudomonadota bacterium]